MEGHSWLPPILKFGSTEAKKHMDLQAPFLQAFISGTGVAIQLYIAERSRRQVAKQSRDTLDIQHLVSQRSTAAFVADKRQKWIDELRTDMAFHLALSQEMAWKWDAVRARTNLRVSQEGNSDAAASDRIRQDAADAFSVEHGKRDRDHQERHIRIKFRLNPKEDLHITLRKCLDDIRTVLNQVQSASTKIEAKALLDRMTVLVDTGARLTEEVLKAEWQRVKQEVAYPAALMASIPEPKGA